jgi:hypothetical protein
MWDVDADAAADGRKKAQGVNEVAVAASTASEGSGTRGVGDIVA